MRKKTKKLPKFKNENEERDFWGKNDATEYFDVDSSKSVRFPSLKPSTKTISLRLPEDLLEEIKIAANKKDIPYQSYIKMILNQKINDDVA